MYGLCHLTFTPSFLTPHGQTNIFMPQFSYQGIDATGKRVRGRVEASTEPEAKSLLRKGRIRITGLKSKQPRPALALWGGVRLKDVTSFTRQFAAMNSSAIPLVQSLDSIAEQTENPAMQQAVRKICMDVQSGVSLADALGKYPKIFNRLYCSMVKAGEAAGILSDVLLRLADYQEKSVAMRRRIKSAFAYPILVGIVAIGALIALMTFVVPTFSSMLKELGAELPLCTRLVIDASDIIKMWIVPALLLSTIGGIAFAQLYKKNGATRLKIDSLMLKLPLFGNLQKKSAVSRFSRTFGSLLSGGIPIAEALEITASTAGNRVLELGFMKSLEAIRQGQSLSAPLKMTGIFPPMVVQMVDVGERSGQLPAMLVKISDYYDTEIDSVVSMMTSVLEPALIVVMGIIIAGVLIAMYLPMFEMVNSIG